MPAKHDISISPSWVSSVCFICKVTFQIPPRLRARPHAFFTTWIPTVFCTSQQEDSAHLWNAFASQNLNKKYIGRRLLTCIYYPVGLNHCDCHGLRLFWKRICALILAFKIISGKSVRFWIIDHRFYILEIMHFNCLSILNFWPNYEVAFHGTAMTKTVIL